MPKRSRKYETGLLERLNDRGYAINYLNAAADDSVEALLLALKDVADAQKGMTRVSRDAHVNRENLYRMLSKAGNPRLSSFRSVLKALHFRFQVEDELTASRTPVLFSQQRWSRQALGTARSRQASQMQFAFVVGSPCQNSLPAAEATYFIGATSDPGERALRLHFERQSLGMALTGRRELLGNSQGYQQLGQRSVRHGETKELQTAVSI